MPGRIAMPGKPKRSRVVAPFISTLAVFVCMLVLGSMLMPGVAMPAYACVGARPLAMGGAFVAVADDSSAVYWNPAGLAQLKSKELSLTYTLNNRDTFNYDEFLVYAEPDTGKGAGGISWIKEHYLLRVDDAGELYYSSNWFTYSYARRPSRDFYVGANIRYEKHSLYRPNVVEATGNRWGIDLGMLYKATPRLSLGLLVQDINGSPVAWSDGSETLTAVNIRPGIAYRPDNATTVALDLYDIAGEGGPPGTIRFGVERWLTKKFAIRGGYYQIDETSGSITAGVGYRSEKDNFEFDYVFLGPGLRAGDKGLGNTHQIGVSLRF
ncbi:MAG TPA: hypothetical protein GXX51_11610 [Firmicutes bacterium]|nr:hypothetical protein [Bacillota bacterium]